MFAARASIWRGPSCAPKGLAPERLESDPPMLPPLPPALPARGGFARDDVAVSPPHESPPATLRARPTDIVAMTGATR
jgi:hypothetical protein